MNSKYVKRLFDEWSNYGKIIIGVDFDSTLSPYHTIDNTEDIMRCISLIKKAKETGAYVVVYTCCDPGRYEGILGFCTNNGIKVDAVNKNPIALPYGHDTKPYCNIYLDDRAGLCEAMNILEEAMFLLRGKKNTTGTLEQVF